VLAASMVVIGDEILGGYVTDTNSPWIAERLREHGVPLTYVHVVPDDPAEIDRALQAELAVARPRLILTSGGIGSTPDDVTYEAVAASLGLPVEEDERIAQRLDRVLDWSREQGLEVTDAFAWHLKRMARVPAGSELLVRRGGWVPGVVVHVDGGIDAADGASVVILPGVPSEFRAIVDEAVEPALLADRNDPPVVEEIEHGFPESALNLTFVELMERFPDVKLGSYPGRPMLVRLTGSAHDVRAAADRLRDALARLEASPAGARLVAAWGARSGATEEDQ
jgi:molybdenum cofactor synthesis domain-containing protein